jgi:divalent metal cation (Fe/Co/Zn/Cd) transporter
VALGQSWGDPVAGLAVTAFICHVGYEVTADVVHRLADGVDPDLPVRDADELGRQVAAALAREVPEAGSLTWTTRAAPA